MSAQINKDENPIISTRSTPEFKTSLDEAAELRGHTRSQALDEILRLGFPRYIKKFPQKYERVEIPAS